MVLCVARGAIRCVAEAEGRNRAIGDDVVGDSGVESRHRERLDEEHASDLDLTPVDPDQGAQTLDRSLGGVLGEPRAAGVAALAMEYEIRDEMAEAAEMHLAVGRLEKDRQRRCARRIALLEQRRQRVELDRELLSPEEQEPDLVREAVVLCEVASQLERDRHASLHVARAEPDDGFVRQRAREVVLGGNGVVVACEDDEWELPPTRGKEEERLVAFAGELERGRDEAQQVGADRGLVMALRRDVDELERA